LRCIRTRWPRWPTARSGLLISMATWVGNLDPFEKKNLEFLE
jgi:hypothetical protein